ncbi:hypothetical protein CC86DRAFT_405255 [Ophiobolus disseminans]|uniref:Uncharacterized protein n=1 Tax=Ophiobolus disseminans TaxID=1469910 RepID=A0A6A7A619_9PLEO|nr:hypothetical protein CC86DRAFT_405255 [Ophiobolus disseminans]
MRMHLLDLQAAGAFPGLQRFILWDAGSMPGVSETHFHVRDIATRSTTHYPRLLAEGVDEGWYLPEFADKEGELYMVRDRDGRDWFGYPKNLEKALVHEVLWRQTVAGVRLPPTGNLGNGRPELCGDELLSMEYLKEKELEQMAGGYWKEPKVPAPRDSSSFHVSVERH